MKRCLLTLVVALLAGPAHAQPNDAQPEAALDPGREAALTAIYQNAQADFLAKRYTEALPQFEQVARELGSPNAQLYVARSLRELGRRVDARAAMQRTVEMAAAHPDREKFAPTGAAAASELAEIEAMLGQIEVVVEAPPEGLRVEVAGRALAQLDERVFVEPGTVRIDALAPGRALLRQEVTVAAGARETVTIRMPAPPPPEPTVIIPPPTTPPPAAPVERERAASEGGTVRIVGYVVAGIGVAGWVTFIAAGLASEDLFDALSRECGGPCPDASYQERIDRGRVLDTVANVGLGFGIAGTVAGVLMIALGGASDAPADSGWLPLSSSDGAGLGYVMLF